MRNTKRRKCVPDLVDEFLAVDDDGDVPAAVVIEFGRCAEQRRFAEARRRGVEDSSVFTEGLPDGIVRLELSGAQDHL